LPITVGEVVAPKEAAVAESMPKRISASRELEIDDAGNCSMV